MLVRHIPGRFNILADRLRRLPISIFLTTGYPNIDLFVTPLNNRLQVYVSPNPDDKALAIDVLSTNWVRIHGHAFRPFLIILLILNKIRQFLCRILLLAVLWPQKSWFPELLQLLVAPPVTLPNIADLLGQFKWEFLHQNPQMLAQDK